MVTLKQSVYLAVFLWRILSATAASLPPRPRASNIYAPPPGHDFPSCAARSEQPTSFRVRRLTYNSSNQVVSGVRGGSRGKGGREGRRATTASPRLQFDLTNNSNNYTVHCDMTSERFAGGGGSGSGDDDPTSWVSCGGGGTMRIPEVYNISTFVQFDRPSANLVVNQTWFCDDVNPEYPIGFHGQSDGKVQNFTCTSTGGAENCAAPDFQVYLWVYDRFDLPPYALGGSSTGSRDLGGATA